LSAGPLAGIRVLDAGTMLAAPYGATLLGDLGADVIKVESPLGDDSRLLGPEKNGERAPFLSMNRNKRGVVLDLTKTEGRAAFARLAGTADVLITNIREPALTKLGLSYEQVREHRADVIWVGVSAFGPDGPYARRPGIDFLAQGYAGIVAQTGDPWNQPIRVTVPVVDVMTSLLVSSGVLAALHARTRTGQGQRVEISLLDAAVHAQASFLGSYFLAGEVVPRTGNRSQYFAPSGIFATADHLRVCLTCPSDKFFRHLCRALDVSWHEDPRFTTNDARLANQDALEPLIARRCGDFTRAELVERLIAADVLVAPVQELPEVAVDPQVLHNQMVATVEHATVGPLRVTGVPIHLHGTPGSVRLAPPVLGQHTREILAEVGYSAAQIAELEALGAARAPRSAETA
jgi:crotonobetainyl-CoA:carnitine CoA-transferase CaiB-like acyl-CoA transferase